MADVPSDVTGLYQYVIGGLVFAVSALGGAVAIQWKAGNDINKARLTERDVLNKTLTDTNLVMKDLVETARRRTEVSEKLGELINHITVAMKLLSERLDLQHERMNDDLAASIDAVRVLAASVQQLNTNLSTGVAEIKGKIEAIK